MKIAIYANCHPGSVAGGTQVYLGALVRALGELTDGPEEYVVLAPAGNEDWLRPLLGSNQRIEPLFIDPAGMGRRVIRKLGRVQQKMVGRFATFREAEYRHLNPSVLSDPGTCLPVSNGFIESLGVSLIHFPYQDFVITSLPSIFNPHDLQHLHLPQFFTPNTLLWRELAYPFACRLASRVVVASKWIAADLCSKYSLPSEKVVVIPWGAASAAQAPPTAADVQMVRQKYGLPEKYIFYPAVAWPHKNHSCLIAAVALLSKGSHRVHLVLSGAPTGLTPSLKMQVTKLGLESLVHFVGLLPAGDMRAVYNTASAVVVPTLFEAASGPVAEGWQECVPVACSDLPQLREQAEGAACFFDPMSTPAIAEAITRVVFDSTLRDRLITAGNQRLRAYSWRMTAIAYRNLYRQVAQGGFGLVGNSDWRL